MKFFKTVFIVFAVMFSVIGCADTSKSDKQLELVLLDTSAEAVANNFDVSVIFGESSIIVSENAGETVINSIPIGYDEYQLFLEMLDAENGYLLYCSSPAGGKMMKYLYTTNDRWSTYSEIDISNKIDGYPTSLLVLSSEHFYIGTQMRSNGYLFETIDSGEQWASVYLDKSIDKCSYGYVPIFDEYNGIIYTLLEYEGSYLLYKLNDEQTTWEKMGIFTFDSLVERFFVDKGSLYIIDLDGRQYNIEPTA